MEIVTQLTMDQVAMLAAAATIVGVAIRAISLAAELAVARWRGQQGNGNGHANGNGRVAALAERHDDLRDEMRTGFANLTGKMDTQHQEIHRRISEMRDQVHTATVEAVKGFATKEEVRRVDDRLRNIESGRARVRR